MIFLLCAINFFLDCIFRNSFILDVCQSSEYAFQKQPSGGVLKNNCSENMQQIYRNLQSNFIEITLWHGCSPVNFLHIFRTPFLRNTSRWLLLAFGVGSKIANNVASCNNLQFSEAAIPYIQSKKQFVRFSYTSTVGFAKWHTASPCNCGTRTFANGCFSSLSPSLVYTVILINFGFIICWCMRSVYQIIKTKY